MNLDHLSKCIWGYRKSSVYEYVAILEEEFSSKMLEKDSERKESEAQYRARITELEEELRRVNEELSKQKSEEAAIASALVEAAKYGESMREELRAKSERELAEWEKKLSEKNRELDEYGSNIRQIRQVFRDLLREMDEKAQEYEKKVESVKTARPGRNMTLFKRIEKADA